MANESPFGFGYIQKDPKHFLFRSRSEIESFCRKNVNPLLVEDNIYRINMLAMYYLYVDSTDESVGQDLLRDGFWEIWITQFLSRQIKPGWSVIDIGANYGYYSMMFADFVGHEGTVKAFEPNPYLYNLICESRKENHFEWQLSVYPVAISNWVGTTKLGYEENRLGDGSILDRIKNDFSKDVETQVTTLDEIIAWPVNLIKIDVEGAEPEVLQGAERVLTENEDIIVCVEWVPSRYENPQEMLDYIVDLGFKIMTISPMGTLAHEKTKQEILDGADWEMLYLVRQI